jgi:hypothetical protein
MNFYQYRLRKINITDWHPLDALTSNQGHNTMKTFLFLLFFLLPLESMAFAPANPNNITVCAGKEVLGRIEKVMLVDKNLTLDAKLDTGAGMASLSAQDIEIYQRDDKNWVKFTVFLPANNEKISFDQPLIKYVHILKREEENTGAEQTTVLDEKKYSARPVIMLTVCIGDQHMPVLVNLANRTHFLYPMLIGTDALKKFNLLVDVSKDYAGPLSCAK